MQPKCHQTLDCWHHHLTAYLHPHTHEKSIIYLIQTYRLYVCPRANTASRLLTIVISVICVDSMVHQSRIILQWWTVDELSSSDWLYGVAPLFMVICPISATGVLLKFSMVAYSKLKYPMTHLSTGREGAPSSGYLNKQRWQGHVLMIKGLHHKNAPTSGGGGWKSKYSSVLEIMSLLYQYLRYCQERLRADNILKAVMQIYRLIAPVSTIFTCLGILILIELLQPIAIIYKPTMLK